MTPVELIDWRLPMKSSLSVENVWFLLSLAVLAFLYGTAVGKWKWVPYSVLARATEQAQSLYHSWSSAPYRACFMGPRAYDRVGIRTPIPERVQPGMTLVASYWTWEETGRSGPGFKLIDRRGQTVHEWRVPRSELFPDSIDLNGDPKKSEYHGSYLFPNGDLLANLEYIGTVRLDACRNVIWTLAEKNHHSIARAEDGSFWIPGVSPERRTRSERFPDGYPGIEEPVWLDQILHVSEGGEVLDRIPVLDVLYENNLERHLVKALGPHLENVPDDPTHLNDVEPLDPSRSDEYPLFEAGDLLVSLRHPSLVFVFDPESRDVKWHASHPFIHQHDPDFVGDGWIGVFDNNTDPTKRGTMLQGSRIVFLQPHTDSMKVPFPTRHSAPFYTATGGSWQLLENGNMLLTEARFGRIVEVAPSGRTVWEWVRAPYDESRIPFVSEGTRYDLSRNEVASWACSSVDSLRPSSQGE